MQFINILHIKMPQEDQETKKWYHIANKQSISIYLYTTQVNAQGYNIYVFLKHHSRKSMVELPEFLSSSSCFIVDGWYTRSCTNQIGHWRNPVRNLWMPAKSDTMSKLWKLPLMSFSMYFARHLHCFSPLVYRDGKECK